MLAINFGSCEPYCAKTFWEAAPQHLSACSGKRRMLMESMDTHSYLSSTCPPSTSFPLHLLYPQQQQPHHIELTPLPSVNQLFNTLLSNSNLPHKWHQKQQPRPQPLVARPQQAERHQLKRRRLARRLPLHLARRRSAPRPERRHTPPTSTRVSFHPNCAFVPSLH